MVIFMENGTYQYDDIVRVSPDAPEQSRRGQIAWIIAVIEDRVRFPFPNMPDGVIYTIEFEDGSAIDIGEQSLENI